MSSVSVNWVACDGRGLCSELLPERISPDEWGFPIVDGAELPPDLVPAARASVAACPTMALRLTNSRGG
ncbi:MAG: ferredoxin [Mycobacteriales bacterium]